MPLYVIALVMMKFASKMFTGLAFDSGGVTAGGLTSAFLTPLTLGIAQAVNADTILTNGFGIIAFMSVTPLIAVQTLGIIYEKRYKKLRKVKNEQELIELNKLSNNGGTADDK